MAIINLEQHGTKIREDGCFSLLAVLPELSSVMVLPFFNHGDVAASFGVDEAFHCPAGATENSFHLLLGNQEVVEEWCGVRLITNADTDLSAHSAAFAVKAMVCPVARQSRPLLPEVRT